mmetsp:Transcript_25098/g.62771  ORF Transcript_25098/g.62771 Transcript_25098/m.62771 type:complete len:103 (-) Transcript_25098:14-322(-)
MLTNRDSKLISFKPPSTEHALKMPSLNIVSQMHKTGNIQLIHSPKSAFDYETRSFSTASIAKFGRPAQFPKYVAWSEGWKRTKLFLELSDIPEVSEDEEIEQ